MAEIGENRQDGNANEDNPFSFKSFVKRTSTDVGVKRSGKGRKTSSSSTALDSGVVPFPEEDSDNPFSFKQFVKKQTLTGVSEGSSSSDDERSLSNSVDVTHSPTGHPLVILLPSTVSSATSSSTVPKMPKTLSSTLKPPLPFPPTVTIVTEGRDTGKKQQRLKERLFSDSWSDSHSFTSTSRESSLPFQADVVAPVTIPTSSDVLGGVETGEVESILLLSDSSDDSVVVSHGRESSVGLQSSTESHSERLLQQCSQLSSENRQLKAELEAFRDKYQLEKQKNSKLHDQLQALKKKEAEETKALEDMVAKVEENLVTSTKRAMSAEKTVSLLKQELQSLQAQLSQSDAQSVHRHYEELLSGVRDKATYASRQLTMASMSADQSIRELLSGVETLQNVAQVLQFIDRISEVKQH